MEQVPATRRESNVCSRTFGNRYRSSNRHELVDIRVENTQVSIRYSKYNIAYRFFIMLSIDYQRIRVVFVDRK